MTLLDEIAYAFGYERVDLSIDRASAQMVGITTAQAIQLGVECAKLGLTIETLQTQATAWMIATGGFVSIEDVRAIRAMKMRWEQGLD